MTDNMEFTPAKELSYTKAVAELEAILRHMQSDECYIDSLTKLTRRSSELLLECRKRLTATDEELKSILSSFDVKE